jgi:hypothetical protein
VEWGEAYARDSGLKRAEVTAQPRPVSPFNWMVVVRSGEEARYSFINLVRREPLRPAPDAGIVALFDAAYLPLPQAQWVRATRFGSSAAERAVAREAWSQPRFAFYRWFAEEPVLLRVVPGLEIFHSGAWHLAVPLWHVPGGGGAVAAIPARRERYPGTDPLKNGLRRILRVSDSAI